MTKRHSRKPVPVIALDIETNKVKQYASITQASKATGVDKRRIHRLITEGGQQQGLKFFSKLPEYGRHKLHFNFPNDVWEQANELAAWKNISIVDLVRRAIYKEVDYLTTQKAEYDKAVKLLELTNETSV